MSTETAELTTTGQGPDVRALQVAPLLVASGIEKSHRRGVQSPIGRAMASGGESCVFGTHRDTSLVSGRTSYRKTAQLIPLGGIGLGHARSGPLARTCPTAAKASTSAGAAARDRAPSS